MAGLMLILLASWLASKHDGCLGHGWLVRLWLTGCMSGWAGWSDWAGWPDLGGWRGWPDWLVLLTWLTGWLG